MPIPVISVQQMREWETASWSAGRTEAEVIRRVGNAVAVHAMRLTRPSDRILVLAGKGHNGDDAKAATAHFETREVHTLEVADPATDLESLRTQLARKPALVIDGLFGIGLNRPLSPAWIEFIQTLNHSARKVLAVDLPSGLDGGTGGHFGAAVEAAVTLSVAAPKTGLLAPAAWPFVGRLEMADDVGLIDCPCASELLWTSSKDFSEYPPPRKAASHKGTYGHLAVLAGSPGFHGAAVLAARAAQRAQPGLITLHAVDPIYYAVASQLQAVMVAPWEPGPKIPGEYTCVLMGPGLADPAYRDRLIILLRHLWRELQCPLVVDASALDWLPLESPARNAMRVLTPHPGEAARMLRSSLPQVQADRVSAVRNLSKRYGNAWIVLKGHQTIIGRSTGPVYVNSSGNAHLAQGGSGDALAGYLAALLAQPALQTDALRTIRFAVWQHGAAADHMQSQSRNWVIEELISELGTRMHAG